MRGGVTRDGDNGQSAVTRDGAPADRQARFKANMAARGVGQLNLMAPAEAHPALKEIARRARSGEPLATVLASVARRTGNQARAVPPLAVPADLQPEPGAVALAMRLHRKASGSVWKRVREAGLSRSKPAAAWVGVLPAAAADVLARRVAASGGTVVQLVGRAE